MERPLKRRWSTPLKLWVATLAVAFFVWLLYRLSLLWTPITVAIILAYLLNLPVEFLTKRLGMNRGPAIMLVLLVLIGGIVIFFALMAPYLAWIISSINVDLNEILQYLDKASDRTWEFYGLKVDLHALYSQSLQDLTDWMKETHLPTMLNTGISFLASGALTVVSNTVRFLFWLAVILVTTFYILKDAYKLKEGLIQYLPGDYKEELLYLVRELGLIWDAFFRGRLLVTTINGVLVWIGLALLGVHNAALMGLATAVIGFVPTIGPVVAAIPSMLLAYFLGSSVWTGMSHLWLTVAVALLYVGVFQLETWVTIPLIVGARVQLHPAIVILGAIAGAEVDGIVGIFLAAPVIASLRLLADYAYRRLLDMEPVVPKVAEETQVPPRTIHPESIRAVLFDFDGTLVETDDAMVESWTRRLGWLDELPLLPVKPRPSVRKAIMFMEGPANGLVTLLNKAHMAHTAFALEEKVRSSFGHRKPPDLWPVEGVIPLLHCLEERYTLGIVTTRDEEDVKRFLEEYNLTGVFSVIVARGDVRRFKPHPEPLLKALEKIHTSPKEAIFVGDTPIDVQAAKAAGTFSVGVLCGFGEEQEMSGADLVLKTTADLYDLLCRQQADEREGWTGDSRKNRSKLST